MFVLGHKSMITKVTQLEPEDKQTKHAAMCARKRRQIYIVVMGNDLCATRRISFNGSFEANKNKLICG